MFFAIVLRIAWFYAGNLAVAADSVILNECSIEWCKCSWLPVNSKEESAAANSANANDESNAENSAVWSE